ncbi:hypothetical protein PO124_25685 [Bacillus licheniformis]|nr:hypothetical protein [Bacillus licheniformis]
MAQRLEVARMLRDGNTYHKLRRNRSEHRDHFQGKALPELRK